MTRVHVVYEFKGQKNRCFCCRTYTSQKAQFVYSLRDYLLCIAKLTDSERFIKSGYPQSLNIPAPAAIVPKGMCLSSVNFDKCKNEVHSVRQR